MATQKVIIIRIFLLSAFVTVVIVVTKIAREYRENHILRVYHRTGSVLRYDSYQPRPHQPEAPKIILLGNSWWGIPDWDLGLGQKLFQDLGCRYECFITNDHRFFNQSAAVLYHIHELGARVPKRASSDQRWVFFMLESPGWSQNLNYRLWNSHFNWTMTYRLDSDIPMVYGEAIKIPEQPVKGTVIGGFRYDINSTKDKLVAWMVSNCNTQSSRAEYVKELQKYLPVDVYGRCGSLRCTKNNTIHDTDCMGMIVRTYKFYLAFENSFCKDYITEKFFKTLTYPIVPVVRGGAVYRKFVPADENWFIDAADFAGPKQLAEYLISLDKNPPKYAKYLEGRARYTLRTYFEIKESPSWCELCRKLQDTRRLTKVYNNISEWWGPHDCHLPVDLN